MSMRGTPQRVHGSRLACCRLLAALPSCLQTLRERSCSPPSCVQLASRAARSEAAPSYLLQLVSAPGGGGPPRAQLLECDLATLRSLSAAADAALRAADGPRARRLRRQLK